MLVESMSTFIVLDKPNLAEINFSVLGTFRWVPVTKDTLYIMAATLFGVDAKAKSCCNDKFGKTAKTNKTMIRKSSKSMQCKVANGPRRYTMFL